MAVGALRNLLRALHVPSLFSFLEIRSGDIFEIYSFGVKLLVGKFRANRWEILCKIRNLQIKNFTVNDKYVSIKDGTSASFNLKNSIKSL